MANVLLGVTGSVAAIRTLELFAALRQAGHVVKVVATRAALYFFDPAGFASADKIFFVDADEWPGRDIGRLYQRDDPVLHIELRRWADLLLIAPLDANTLAKLANGLCDNCLTCVWRAWDPNLPVVLAPAMNTLMWEHPLTARHLRLLSFQQISAAPADLDWTSEHPRTGRYLRQLFAQRGNDIPAELDQDGVVAWLNRTEKKLGVAPPQNKRLACGDVGVGAMAALEQIVGMVGSLVK